MMEAVEASLDDILSRWHHWASTACMVRGFAPLAAGCWNYRASRQYDDANGALDGDLEDSTMAVVDFQVSEMRDPWRAAIHAHARNLNIGRSVWRSPRLPEDRQVRADLVREACCMLAKRLTTAGVL